MDAEKGVGGRGAVLTATREYVEFNAWFRWLRHTSPFSLKVSRGLMRIMLWGIIILLCWNFIKVIGDLDR